MRWAYGLWILALAAGCGDGGADAPFDAGSDVIADAAVDQTEAVYDPTRLLDIQITMNEADWDLLRFEHHDFLAVRGTGCQDGPTESPYSFFPADVTIDGVTIEQVGIRKKGFLGSVVADRPSLKIKFHEYVAGQEFSGLKRLTLNNNNQDDSQVNACITYALFRQAGVPAPRCNFARVSVNGTDLGIYSNVEGIKKPLVARFFSDDGGNLYEGQVSDFRSGWTATFQLKTNTTAPDRSDLEAVEPALFRPVAEVADALDEVVDVEAFLTFWAMESLVDHWDGYAGDTNNFYVYHDPTTDKLHFIPWGADSVFGLPNRFPPFDRPPSVHAVSAIPHRLYEIPDTRDRYRARLREVLDQVWDEPALLAEVDRMEALIADYVHVPEGELQAGLARVRTFIENRRAAIEADLDGPAPSWDAPLRVDPCMHKAGDVSCSFDTTWEVAFPPAFPLGLGSGTLTMVYGGAPVLLSSVGFSAGKSESIGGLRQAVLAIGVRQGGAWVSGIYVGVNPELYRAGVDLPINNYDGVGLALEGPFGEDPQLAGFGFGVVHFDQAGTAPGEAVSGSVTLEMWR